MDHISLGVTGEYKDLAIKLVNSIKASKKVKNMHDTLEIDIFMDDNKKEETKIFICWELTNIIINTVKNKVLKEMINRSYKDMYITEIDDIYEYSLNLFKEREVSIRDILFKRIYEYLSSNDYINVNGFVKFRLRDFMDYIIQIKDRGLEEYLLQKDYSEFIQLLKYFVDLQEEKIDILKLYIEKNGTFKICDKYDRDLESSYTKDIFNLALKENMNYEDFLISVLITLSPREILIYDRLENNVSKEIIQTIESIFEGRVKVNYRV
ncbi:putative sporulation protein YtxC [Tepidibacter thalassicus]|uniref:Putative sporulation protein YtxC n=1 Tax=Tepidibacter thalassicus DSM 15285 TaxID=1123350 RepID=A0A1M5RRZ1_9FIRM|nr:putative sporulation protein YtxC [Tepidibacter thalassicus]SHH29092.1 putative sporulation protein YtxC [Tepidibacter thalassicus DSM 15285]